MSMVQPSRRRRPHRPWLILLFLLILVFLEAHLVRAQQYTNVIYVGATGTGSYGATNYVNACNAVPVSVLSKYPLCKQGSPLAGLRLNSTSFTDFRDRFGFGSIVGPTGVLIAASPLQFYTDNLNNSLSQAGVACTSFFSSALPNSGATPNGMNDGCALGMASSLGSNSGLRKFYQGSCSSTTVGTWFSQPIQPTCATSTSLLCFCTSMNTPTSSPTPPTSAPSKNPTTSPTRSVAPSKSPSKSPTLSTTGPSRSPSVTATLPPSSQAPSSVPTASPTLHPTFQASTTNVLYTAYTSSKGDLGAQNYINACANIPSNVRLNFPLCTSGTPLASLRVDNQVTNFIWQINSGNVVGPNGFVIADNATQFYAMPLKMTLGAAEVGCSTFFSGSLTTGLANAGATECATSSTGNFLSSESENRNYRRGSCSSNAVGWFSTGTAKCEASTSFVCVCRVFATGSPVPAPSAAPSSPTTPTTLQPTTRSPTASPTKLPTKEPTTLAPTRRPSTSRPTFGVSEYSVVYVGATSARGNFGAANFINTCKSIPEALYDLFPLCEGGEPFASLRVAGVTTQFNSRILAGAVYGSNGRLLAETPAQLYGGGLNATLSDAGVACSTFFSGTLATGLAATGTSQCSTSSTGDFLSSNKDDYNFRYGSCSSKAATWFSTGNGDCEETSTSMLCFCRVAAATQPPDTSQPTPAPNGFNSSTIQDGTSEDVLTIVAWGMVGILAAVLLAAAGLVYLHRARKQQLTGGRALGTTEKCGNDYASVGEEKH